MGTFRPSRTIIDGAGELSGKRSAHAGGAGVLSTGAGKPRISVLTLNKMVITTIEVDLTGLASKNDVDDVIGLAAGGTARLTKVTAAEMGQIYKVVMSCSELPTASSNVGLDIDLRSGANQTRAYDFDLSGATSIIAAGGNWALGKTIEQLVTVPADGHALYLTTGAAHTGDSTYTAGQLVITLFGHKLR
tara:strand:- start:137 stop:706 length:570 start_codon:yes stop_codon:yes gene_type:complete